MRLCSGAPQCDASYSALRTRTRYSLYKSQIAALGTRSLCSMHYDASNDFSNPARNYVAKLTAGAGTQDPEPRISCVRRGVYYLRRGA
jgi:hypothetical protein